MTERKHHSDYEKLKKQLLEKREITPEPFK